MAESEYCPTCGTSLREHTHTLNPVLVNALIKLWKAGPGPHHISELELTRSEDRNFQKLRYFRLVAMCFDEEGLHKRGWWEITAKGELFASGVGYCYPKVVTYLAEPIEFLGEPIEIIDRLPEFQTYEDYVAAMRPHRLEAQ